MEGLRRSAACSLRTCGGEDVPVVLVGEVQSGRYLLPTRDGGVLEGGRHQVFRRRTRAGSMSG